MQNPERRLSAGCREPGGNRGTRSSACTSFASAAARRAAALLLFVGAGGCALGSAGPARSTVAAAPAAPAAMQPVDERLLIRRASLALETRDVTRVERVAGEMARASGGYIQSSVNDGGALRMTVRVAVARLDATLDTLSALGKVTSRSQSTDDVTEQLVDLDARIASLTVVRDRMREHLRQAASLGDVFTIERELARIQADLDSLIARRKALGSLVELAELSLTARPKVRLGPLGVVAVGVGRLVEKLFVLE